MENIAGRKSALGWVVQISVVFLVLAWLLPTVGLLVSSFRDRDQITQSGWWTSALPVTMNFRTRVAGDEVQEGDSFVLQGNVFADPANAARFASGSGTVAGFGTRAVAPDEFAPGTQVDLRSGGTATVAADGAYRVEASTSFGGRGPTLYFQATTAPTFTLDNYRSVLTASGMERAFINTLTVTIPATIIPILIAAFAAYALAWMEFPGRALIIAGVVGLLVVPLQLALVPLLTLHTKLGIGQSFVGVWLAHIGFGLPLAIYLLRNYMAGLPRDIIESARVDGATDFQIFTRIILPLSFPALASFAIFQFLWTWNDLLVAKVFLPPGADAQVMTVKIADDLLGSRGGDWGILAAAAFVSIAVPLVVFFSLQRFLVRGLLAGSVK